MMKINSFFGLVLLATSSLVHAKAPVIDYQVGHYYASQSECVGWAKEILIKNKFKISSSINAASEEVVGKKNNYKAVVTCLLGNDRTVVFIVAGANYKVANTYALDLQEGFK